MALHKLSKPKSFNVLYCGCTAASFLLNEQTIRDSIQYIRRVKGKQEYVRTNVVVSKEGIRITYEHQERFSTVVPSTMIAASALGKSPFHDTVGVIYISPFTGDHYPAFIHTYRCETSRIAEKLFSRLQAYLFLENHRHRLIQLEQNLLDRNLLNINAFNAKKSQISDGRKSNPTQPVLPPASTSSLSSRSSTEEPIVEKRPHPMKSVTEEFQRKINAQEPILFPPKDYDTLHAAHGHIHRAQEWKSTEPAIVGYTPTHNDENPSRSQLPTKHVKTNGERNSKSLPENNPNERLRLTSQRSDVTADPVETVSLAFDFLKEETGSIFNEPEPVKQPADPAIYRFRPAHVPLAANKKWLERHNHQHQIELKHRARSETRLADHYAAAGLPMNNARFGNGAPVSTNPLWSGHSPVMIGSQPNLLSPSSPFHRHASPSTSSPHPMYSSHVMERPQVPRIQQTSANAGKSGPLHRKQLAQSEYFDTNEFILRPSTDQMYPNRYSSTFLQGTRTHPTNMNNHQATMLDVYY